MMRVKTEKELNVRHSGLGFRGAASSLASFENERQILSYNSCISVCGKLKPLASCLTVLCHPYRGSDTKGV